MKCDPTCHLPNPARATLTRNTIYNAASRIWIAGINVVLLAYIVRRIGPEGFGMWSLVSAFTGYVALFDLGMNSAYAKYIAEHAARNESEEISAVVSTGFFFYLVLGMVVVGIGWPCIDPLIHLFLRLAEWRGRPVQNLGAVEDFRALLRWALVLFAVSNCVAAFTAIQTGFQRMGVTCLLSVISSFIKVATTVLFLEMGCGVRGLLYSNAAVLGVFALASVVAAYRLFPRLRLSTRCIHRSALGRLFQFGWRSQVSRLANLIMFETDVIVVAGLSSALDLVGLYGIGVSLANKMRQLPSLVVSAVVPAASDLDARADQARLESLYLRATKYTAVAAIPAMLWAVVAAAPLVRLAAGTDYAAAVWVLRIIALGYVANIIPGAGIAVVLGKGRADLQMKAGLISMVSNIVLTVTLAYAVGFWGIALATAASMVISCAWFMKAAAPTVGIGPARVIRTAVMWPLLAAMPGFGACLLLDRWMAAIAGPAGFWGALGTIVASACLFAVFFLLCIRLSPFLDSFDVAFLEETMGLRHVPLVRSWLPGRGRHA